MYLIHSYSHSFRTRDVKAGKVYDVVFRVTDERGNVRQKRLSGFATKQNAEKAFVEYVAKFCTLVEDDCAKGFVTVDKSLSEHTLTGALYEIKSTKNGKSRSVPIPDALRLRLDEYLRWKRERGLPAEFLFCTARGGRLPHSTVRRNFAQSIQSAGARRIRLHNLRHSYVSLLVHKGANLAVIADLIGDTIEQVTNTYAHLYESDRKNIIRLLNS